MPPGASGGARRWIWRAILGFGIAGFVAAGLLTTPHGTLAAACTDTWVGGSGNFSAAASWSKLAVPTSADDACITATTITIPPAAADVYQVTLDAGFSVHSLTIGGPNGTQTLLIPSNGAALTLSAASTINSNGVLTMGDSGTGNSTICCSGANLTNLGNINTVTGGGQANRFVRVNITNAASGTVVIGGATVFDDLGGGPTTFTNFGSITITSGILALQGTVPSTFVNSGGTVSNSGSFYISPGTFMQRAGLETGNPVLLANNSVLDDDLNAAAGNFQFRSGAQTLTGTGANPGVGAGQVLTVQSDNSQTTVAKSMTNAGTIILGQAATGTASLCCAGVTLTNTGHLNTVVGGGGNHYFRLNLTNSSSGIVDIAGPTLQDAGGGGSTTTANNGTIILEKAQTLALSGGSTFTQSFGGTFATTIDATATTFGQLTGGGGAVSLNGLLKVTTVGSPAASSSWPIISSANRSGQFSSLDFGALNYGVQYPATGVTLVGLAPCDYWIGGNGNFSNASNWSMGSVPNSATDVCITQTTGSTPPAALDTYTVTYDSTTPAYTVGSLRLGASGGTQTLQLAGNNTQFFLNTTGTINSNGVLLVGDSNVSNGYTWLGAGGGSSLLTNNGTLKTVQGGGGIRFLRVSITNATGGTVDIAAADTRQDPVGSALFPMTNNGAFIVETGAAVALSNGGGFVNQGGSITNNGAFSQSGGTFTQRGGSESGNPILLTAGGLDDDLGAGPAKFTISNPNAPPYPLTGTGSQPGIATGQVVTIAGNNSWVDLNLSLGFTSAGTIVLGDNSGNGFSVLRVGAGSSLTNTGTLKTVQAGGGIRYLRLNITNAAGGTVDIAGADTRLDAAYTFTNNGAFTVEASAGFAISNGGAFTNLAGSMTNNGAFSQIGSTFTQRGGSESGNPVLLKGGVLDDDVSAGQAKFTVTVPNGSPYALTGTGTQPGVASGQVITIAGDNTLVDVAVSLTNAGTMVLGDTGTGWSWLRSTSTVVLTNTGHLNTVQGGGGTRYLRANITNAAAGIIDIGATTVSDVNGTNVTSNGTLVVEPGSTFYLSTGATFTQGTGGTFQTTIDANATKFGQLNGGGDAVTLDGKLKVITVGHPVVGSSWPIISNASRVGTLPGHDFGFWNYDVQYPPTGVTLVAQTTCNVWIGGVDNNFATPTNWLLGIVPTSVDDVCITATTTTNPPANADTYTVLVNGDFPVKSLTLGGASGTQTLNIQSGRRLTLLGNSLINARGVMVLGDAGNGDARLDCPSGCFATGPMLTNNGQLKTVQGGGGRRIYQPFLVNTAAGSVDIAAATSVQDGGCHPMGGMFNNDATINSGMFTVEPAAGFTAACGFANRATGTVNNQGSFSVSGSLFVQRGTESGNPVILNNGSGLDDDSSAGLGSFTIAGASGGISGTGASPGIPPGQVVTVASGATVGVFPNATNAGTLILGDSGNRDAALCCAYFTSGATITNTGTIKTVQGGGGIRHLQVNVTNAPGGIIDIATDTRQDQPCGTGGVNATTIANSGTFTLEATGTYAMTNCLAAGYQNTFTQVGVGTFQTTVDANATKVGSLTGGTVNLDGQLKVTTVGTPAIGSTWPIISGATRVSVFATRDLDGTNYDVKYSPSSATLVAKPLARPYHALPPKRILDTRPQFQVGPFSTPFGPESSRNVTVIGVGGVPTTGVSAVVLNVTVTDTGAASYLTLYPAGGNPPLASNLNWVPGNDTPNLVEVKVGANGQVGVYNKYGTVDVVIDVAGYVSTDGVTNTPDGLYNPVVPFRLLDTRIGNGAPLAQVGPNQTIDVQITGVAGSNVPLAGVSGVVLNVTVTNPTAASHLTVFPTGGSPPLVSNLNFVAGQTVPNRVFVKVGTGGKVSFYNYAGSVDVIADIGGWFTDLTLGGNGTTFTGMTPTRILDTRLAGQAPLGPAGIITVSIAGAAGIPPISSLTPPTAGVLNVTVTNNNAASYLTLWPTGALAMPLASDLNWVPGQTVPNLVVVQIGADGTISLFNAYGQTDVVIDVVGYYS